MQELSERVYKDKDGKMKIKDVPDFAWNALSEKEQRDFMNRMEA